MREESEQMIVEMTVMKEKYDTLAKDAGVIQPQQSLGVIGNTDL